MKNVACVLSKYEIFLFFYAFAYHTQVRSTFQHTVDDCLDPIARGLKFHSANVPVASLISSISTPNCHDTAMFPSIVSFVSQCILPPNGSHLAVHPNSNAVQFAAFATNCHSISLCIFDRPEIKQVEGNLKNLRFALEAIHRNRMSLSASFSKENIRTKDQNDLFMRYTKRLETLRSMQQSLESSFSSCIGPPAAAAAGPFDPHAVNAGA
jgi:hypothetical protein